MRFNLFFQTHWQNICTFSALLSGWFYYIYFEINSYNRSSWSKQIFAVALCLYKLRCSSNTSKWSLSCCPFPEDQEIDKKHCISDAQGDPYSSTAPTFPSMPFAEAHQTGTGQNQRQSCPTGTSQSCHPQPLHFLHLLVLTMKGLCCSLYPHYDVGYPVKILRINPSTKPKFTPQSVSFNSDAKSLSNGLSAQGLKNAC